jgi:hypothetical protein
MPEYLIQLCQPSSLIDQVVEKVKKVVPEIYPYKPGVDEAYLPSIDYFVLHVTRRSHATIQELVMSLIYLSRFHQSLLPHVTGRPSTPHRVFLAALMLANKVYNDDSANNAYWAKFSAIPECRFAGFSNREVNFMEKEFLAALKWDTHIKTHDFSQELCITLARPSLFLRKELHWACGCCICIDRRANPTRGLSHCFACLTPTYPEFEMQKKVLEIEQTHVRQDSAIEYHTRVALHHQMQLARHGAPNKCKASPMTEPF